mmetsp:Transcript_38843/g.65347  ORF Transcript_38843/g.65347 Transcript_38843/m.65347 type:complete len:183 (-) Transcript_38843:117-665(-)|eukprot:CAMPEP_0198209574 /NCGR_PEP_ID=MMETSP1445-20131203/17062_1 /TAXON_ID=36898 /ORGANISM="Pyramimonas sp., Strain CCMP2087" /LENGTH=182 /DNA_ID=CAMNT_0043883401 /DNA_START=73 /DNA_END=621 /DNA_ORIENTATION=+
MQSISGAKFLSMASHAMRAQRCSRQMMPTALARQPVACKALRNPQHARSGIHNTPLLSCKSVRSGRTICSASADGGEQSTLETLILEKNNEHKVIVYSKTYCPFCTRVKDVFHKLNVEATIVELDNIVEGDDIQDALETMTGQRTVPSVFIGGQHVGGATDTLNLLASGELVKMLEAAGLEL